MKDAFERRRHVTTQFRGRISIYPFDEIGITNHERLISGGYKIVVLLDGVEQEFCSLADPDERLVHRLGRPNKRGARQTEIVKGEVVVRLERPTAT